MISRNLLYGVLIGFVALIVIFVSFTFIWSCGLDFSCQQVGLLPVGHAHPHVDSRHPARAGTLCSPAHCRARCLGGRHPGAGETSSIPRPSNPGGPGEALDLKGDAAAGAEVYSANCVACHGLEGVGGVVNPGSADGVVPALNPIDPLLKDPDLRTYAANLDLFLQHGSTPAGPSPDLRHARLGRPGRPHPTADRGCDCLSHQFESVTGMDHEHE